MEECTISHEIVRPVVVVVTGLPASGKSTLARALAISLGLPLFSLDAIKEALHDAAGGARLTRGELRFSAEAVLGALIRDAPCGAVIDIWLDPSRADRDRLRRSLPAGVPVVEVLCDVPAEVAVRRYADRVRHDAHLAADPDLERRITVAGELFAAVRPEDRGLGRVIRVDTTRAVETADVVLAISR